jgi:hypothetical protein
MDVNDKKKARWSTKTRKKLDNRIIVDIIRLSLISWFSQSSSFVLSPVSISRVITCIVAKRSLSWFIVQHWYAACLWLDRRLRRIESTEIVIENKLELVQTIWENQSRNLTSANETFRRYQKHDDQVNGDVSWSISIVSISQIHRMNIFLSHRWAITF